MAIIDLDFSDYVRNVRVSAQSASPLSVRLHKAAPLPLTPEVEAALRAIAARAEEVAAVQAERERLGPARLRPVLATFSNAWNALHEALIALTRLSTPRGQRALALAHSVFPDGVSFVLLDADRAWSEGNRRLNRLRNEGLKATLDELIGVDFFEQCVAVTGQLGDAIGTGDAVHVIPDTSALQEALWRFGHAVGNYGRMMVSSCNEEDPASVERFRRAMAPIDLHRNFMRGSGGDDTTDLDPGEPTTDGAPVSPVSPASPTPVVTRPSPAAPNPFITAEE